MHPEVKCSQDSKALLFALILSMFSVCSVPENDSPNSHDVEVLGHSTSTYQPARSEGTNMSSNYSGSTRWRGIRGPGPK